MAVVEHFFIDKVGKFIRQHKLLDHNCNYLVALSGGADSVALLLVMLKMGYKVGAVHCNFHLRGEEADRDEDFCRRLCEQHDAAFHIAHFATREYAQAHKMSIEMAARFLRYEFFEKLRKDVGADAVAVAHHKDDIAETVIINLIRGTGLHGLAGIAPKRDNIVRPLLCVGRAEIKEFLHDCGQKFVDDSSNFVDDVVRNKVRLNIMPLMREINPSLTDAIADTARRVRMAAGIFDGAMEEKTKLATLLDSPGKHVYDIAKIHDEYTLFYVLKGFGFKSSAIEDIYEAMLNPRTGALFASTSHEMTFHGGKMIVMDRQAAFKTKKLPECGRYVLDAGGKVVDIKRIIVNGKFKMPKTPNTACFDAEKISFPLILRNAGKGDRFQPFGMRGKKLVSNLLTDLKVNALDKQRQLVLTDCNDNIVWVVGRRTDNRYRVDDDTKEVVIVEISQ